MPEGIGDLTQMSAFEQRDPTSSCDIEAIPREGEYARQDCYLTGSSLASLPRGVSHDCPTDVHYPARRWIKAGSCIGPPDGKGRKFDPHVGLIIRPCSRLGVLTWSSL